MSTIFEDEGRSSGSTAAVTYLLGPVSGAVVIAVWRGREDLRYHGIQSVVASAIAVTGFVALTLAQYLLTFLPTVGTALSIAFSLVYPVYALVIVGLWVRMIYGVYRGNRSSFPIAGRIANRYARP